MSTRPPIGDDDERTPTPTERPIRRPASDAALRLARAASILNSLSTEFGRAGGILDRLAENERPVFLQRICEDGRGTCVALTALIDDIEADSIG